MVIGLLYVYLLRIQEAKCFEFTVNIFFLGGGQKFVCLPHISPHSL